MVTYYTDPLCCWSWAFEPHWRKLTARGSPRPIIDPQRFAPYAVHPLAPVDFSRQIPRTTDQRQMERWQRIGVYAAGLALDSAGVKGKPEILSRMDMIVAAGGGERDIAVDLAILNADAKGNSAPGFLNEKLMNDLRPTLFLAQLSNLLAGNIAIVHGVCGTSRTFMGEEAASIDAARAYYGEFARQGSALPSDRRLKVGLIYSYGANDAGLGMPGGGNPISEAQVQKPAERIALLDSGTIELWSFSDATCSGAGHDHACPPSTTAGAWATPSSSCPTATARCSARRST